MRRRALFLSLTLAACATSPATKSSSTAGPSGQATDFSLEDLDGHEVRLSDFAGKVVLLDFWATWCTPCQAELPYLEKIYEKHKAQGFVLLGISMDGPETIATVPTIVRQYDLSFPVLLDKETEVVGIYNPMRTAPFQVLIDRHGRIVKTRQGYDLGDEKLIERDVVQTLKAT